MMVRAIQSYEFLERVYDATLQATEKSLGTPSVIVILAHEGTDRIEEYEFNDSATLALNYLAAIAFTKADTIAVNVHYFIVGMDIKITDDTVFCGLCGRPTDDNHDHDHRFNESTGMWERNT